MARATLGEDYKEFKKEESKCVSPAFTMDDNVSEEPQKNQTTEQRKEKKVDKVKERYASPNTVI